MRTMIGECLRQAGIITEADLQSALVEHKRSGERLGSVLIRMNLATERQIAKALAYQLGFSYVDLAEHPPDAKAVTLIPKEVAHMVQAFRMGKVEVAQKLHHKYYPLFKDLFIETNPIPVKAALAMMGQIQEEYRLPLVPLSQKNRDALRATMKMCGVFKP